MFKSTWFRSIVYLDEQTTAKCRLVQQKGLPWRLAAFFAHSGDSWFWMIGLGVIWLFGNAEWHAKSAYLAFCIVVQALVVFAIKFSIRRSRPEGEWGAIYRNTDPHSFPSGHATRAFLLLVLGGVLGPSWFGWILVVWAPIVAIARVMVGVHYLSDILAGALLGVGFAFILIQIKPLIENWFSFVFFSPLPF